uniref:Uncharacterized protein n=1 Tax=Anopheles merus TaxID=30066 RepID=A0A182VA23_ANOME
MCSPVTGKSTSLPDTVRTFNRGQSPLKPVGSSRNYRGKLRQLATASRYLKPTPHIESRSSGLPLHSLASRALARPHGRSKWNGLQRSQSRPAVLCLQSQLTSPSGPAGTQRNACPLHLHRPPTAKSDTA